MKRSLFVLTALLLLVTARAADIGLSPPRLQLSGRPGETISETVTVLTQSAGSQQIGVSVSDWLLDPEGRLVLLPPGGGDNSASAWLEPEAEGFEISGEQNRPFRISVTIPQDADLNGTYRTMVFFTVVPPPDENSGVGVVTTTQIGLAVYVTVAGTEETGSELVDFFQPDDASLTLSIANTGNTVMRLGGTVELRDEAGETRYRLEVPDVPVLRESDRDVTLTLPEGVEPGFYVALALAEDSRGGLLVGELPIEVP